MTFNKCSPLQPEVYQEISLKIPWIVSQHLVVARVCKWAPGILISCFVHLHQLCSLLFPNLKQTWKPPLPPPYSPFNKAISSISQMARRFLCGTSSNVKSDKHSRRSWGQQGSHSVIIHHSCRSATAHVVFEGWIATIKYEHTPITNTCTHSCINPRHQLLCGYIQSTVSNRATTGNVKPVIILISSGTHCRTLIVIAMLSY